MKLNHAWKQELRTMLNTSVHKRYAIVLAVLSIIALIVSWKLVFVVWLVGLFYFVGAYDHRHDEWDVQDEEESSPVLVVQDPEESHVEADEDNTEEVVASLERAIRVMVRHVEEFPSDLDAKIRLEEAIAKVASLKGEELNEEGREDHEEIR